MLKENMNEQDDGFNYNEEYRDKFDKLLLGFQNKMINKFSPNNF